MTFRRARLVRAASAGIVMALATLIPHSAVSMPGRTGAAAGDCTRPEDCPSLPITVAAPAGSAGTDAALPATDSAVTLSGRPCAASVDGCGFQDIKISVNQTRNLLNQAISVTWSGGRPTVTDNTAVTGNFLQIFQCWGDDDGTNPDNPGPPPEQCQFGGFQSNPAAASALNVAQFVDSRIVSSVGSSTYKSETGFRDNSQGFVWKPFKAVDGTVVNRGANFAANGSSATATGGYWLNPFFDIYTTNEDVVARSHPDGTGSELVTVDTGLEASGLGCGQTAQRLDDGTKVIPKCWLVIVPRGTGTDDNPPEQQTGVNAVNTSPLSAAAWRNRVAVPLEFSPIGASCAIGADERRIAGSELATPAVTSWQPYLCASPTSPPYNYSSLPDDLARQQLVSGVPGAPGMAVVSAPIAAARVDPDDPVVYAPLSLSGVTIGFNIERVPATDPVTGDPLEPAEAPLAGIRVAHINMTPRLVAKLLTGSYQYQFGGIQPPYDWYMTNPSNLLVDPDFEQFNPEFVHLKAGAVGAGRLVLEQPTGDAASAVWRWVLADPEAAAWLAGNADPWGITVNPAYSTDATTNPSGVAFGTPIPNSYPKSDPFCYKSNSHLFNVGNALPRPLCMLDISPYVGSMQAAAQVTRAASDGARTTLDQAATSADTAWVVTSPQTYGVRAMLSVTDTASAARFGLQTANLSRAGDDGSDRAFVAPDAAGLLAGQAAMVPTEVADVLQSDPATKAAGAYPLSMLTYAAVTPRSLDVASRRDYSAFVAYAAGDGQKPGLQFGLLPPGYAPLPTTLQAQATAAAAFIVNPEAETAAEPGVTVKPMVTTTVKPATAKRTVTVPRAARVTSTPRLPSPATTVSPVSSASPPPTGNVVRPRSRPPALLTPKETAGLVRFAIAGSLLVGLISFLAVLVIDDRWLRRLTPRRQWPDPGRGTSGPA